jgi:predicted CXXCH cytochrome family protein
MAVTVAVTTRTVAPGAAISVTVPTGWTILDPTVGEASIVAGKVRWTVGDLPGGQELRRRLIVRAPVSSPDRDPAAESIFRAVLEASNGVAPAPDVRVLVAPELIIEHVSFARIDPTNHVPTYLAVDAPLPGVAAFDAFRVRFQVRNADTRPVAFEPILEYQAIGGARFRGLPADDPELGVPFYLSSEWRPAGRGRPGTVIGPAEESIPVGDIRANDTDGATQRPVDGRRLMGTDAMPRITIQGDRYTEIEFTVRATVDVPIGRQFEFRIVDAGRPLAGSIAAMLTTGSKVPMVLSPGQRSGIDVGPPVEASANAASTSAPLRDDVDYALVPTDSAPLATTAIAAELPRYRLAVAQPVAPGVAGPAAAPFDSVHAPEIATESDTCARCHSTHAAQGKALLPDPNPQSTLCLSCHDGSGSDIDVASQYDDPSVPPNDPTTRSYYRHDAMILSDHVLAGDDEFGGVSARHSECADCHNPHNSVATDAIQTTTGWTVSGRQAALSGVAVTNGAAGTVPAYAFLDGSINAQPTREYEICFKCHSGFTVLPSNTGQPPSRYALDKGIELNPGNASYHPVEAAGTNQTAAMGASLAGTSPYKQWDFLTAGTVRCVNCHGDPAKYDPAAPPAAGSALAPHASQFRGLLLQGYRDRTLKSATEAYAASDFALCYLCHGEEPYLNSASSATNFELHSLHISELAGRGSGGTDIDAPGAGQGNAICAECHFRLHSTAQAVNAGDRSNSRLVNFAPNVLPNSGTLRWTKVGGIGECTLTCHGEPHRNAEYSGP